MISEMWESISSVLSTGLVLLIITLLLLYYYGTKNYGYWKKLGVPYMKPKYPFLGTLYEFQFGYKSVKEFDEEIYEKFQGKPYIGAFCFTVPELYLIDIKLIEAVLVKDFSSFYNRKKRMLKSGYITSHLPNLVDHQWKNIRQKLSPAFSLNKLKGMIEQFLFFSHGLMKNIDTFIEKCEPIESDFLFKRYLSDVIGSCAFGVNANALDDPNGDYSHFCENIYKPSSYRLIMRLMRDYYPNLMKLIRGNRYDERLEEFFVGLINKNKEYREKNNIVRNDFFQSLIDLRKQDAELAKNGGHTSSHLIFDDVLMYSNAFIFYTAGFETVASTLSFCLYDLATHQKVQEKLHHHIVTALKEHKGKITYESINEMSFLNQVISESLRLRPPIGEVRRAVTKAYQIPGTNIVLPKGISIVVPIQCIHMDAKYFPEPEKFLPERFDPEKNTIRKEAYMPYGAGPRMCIGMQFSNILLKIVTCQLILNYKFKLNTKTAIPLKYATSTYFTVPDGGMWFDVEKRM